MLSMSDIYYNTCLTIITRVIIVRRGSQYLSFIGNVNCTIFQFTRYKFISLSNIFVKLTLTKCYLKSVI